MPFIKIDENFVPDFLTPLANIAEKVVLTVEDGKINATANSSDGTILLHIEKDMDYTLDDETNINIGDVVKFKNHVINATDLSDSDEIVLDANKLKYKSKKWRFTLHMFEDGILQKNTIPVSMIANFEYTTKFTLTSESIREIIKLKASNKEVDKVYFKFIDGNVYADVTDYSLDNMDVSGVMVAEDFDGETNMSGCPVDFELIKILSQNRKKDFVVKHAKRGVFLLQSVVNNCSISYILPELKN